MYIIILKNDLHIIKIANSKYSNEVHKMIFKYKFNGWALFLIIFN